MRKQTGTQRRPRGAAQPAAGAPAIARVEPPLMEMSDPVDPRRQRTAATLSRASSLSARISQIDRSVENEESEVSANRRWQQEFDRRSRDAIAGLHHPLVHELILGMPPLHDSLDADAQIFAERLLSRLLDDGVREGDLVDRLEALRLAPTREACRAAALALEEAWRKRSTSEAAFLAEASARCDYYAAAKNYNTEALRTAGRALTYAQDDNLPEVDQLALTEAAVGWLVRAGWDLPDVVERFGPERGGPAVRRAAELGREVLRRISFLLEAQCST
jgi:hypothetical protein